MKTFFLILLLLIPLNLFGADSTLVLGKLVDGQGHDVANADCYFTLSSTAADTSSTGSNVLVVPIPAYVKSDDTGGVAIYLLRTGNMSKSGIRWELMVRRSDNPTELRFNFHTGADDDTVFIGETVDQ